MRNIFKRKKPDIEYYGYGEKGGFTIFVGSGHCLEGHFMIPKSASIDDIGHITIGYVAKVCKEHNMSVSDTLTQINNNLRLNGCI